MDNRTPDKDMFAQSLVNQGDERRIVKAMQKALRKEKVTLGFIGGSITEGALSTSPDNSYVGLIGKWWKEQFPDAQLQAINAGIGSTGSLIGVHRVDQDLLKFEPDLVVVDFSVNDEYSPGLANQYEDLIRKILQSKNKPAVILLFMMRQDGTNMQWAHSPVGLHYDLPMVSLSSGVWPQMQSGHLKWQDYYADDVHPNDAGHRLVSQLIINRLESVRSHVGQSEEPDLASEELPASMTSDGYLHTELLTSDRLAVSSNNGWVKEETARFSPGWIATKPGQSFSFTVEAANIGVIYEKLNNGRMGRVQVQVDDLPPVELEGHFSADWKGYPAGELVAENLDEGKHSVTITFMREHHPDSTGELFKVCAIMASR
ncbi:SGNH/GDSL hydrolase family protein [Cohnella nanjingensis]|uniref:SGNH/GDSL hydrolase family protein n=1 Tax=Cohnella nanjingensis TaxID=1387779 RepID=A0A7X0RVP9_9BACL|nr:SGNH/GDSL hydrolase family protein [Cohnella nanjingensis]MBB6672979.1 SGNH/GDSL hydrolase family protein [Cohnella nanjingensis]